MICTPDNIAVDPIIAGNLQGLAAIRIDYQIDLAKMPVLMAQFPAARLAEHISKMLADAGLKIDEKSGAVLTVAIAVQPSRIPQLNGLSALYAVEVAVRELVLLPRTADDLSGKDNIRIVDSWRHQTTTGIFLSKTSNEDAESLLFAVAIRQTERFVAAWRADQNFQPQPPRPESSDDDSAEPADPADPAIKKIKEKLQDILSKLALGNDGSAKLEKFEVDGSRVDFSAKIRHRHTIKELGIKVTVYDIATRASGSFDLKKPDSLDAKICVEKPAFLGGGEICQPLAGIKDLL